MTRNGDDDDDKAEEVQKEVERQLREDARKLKEQADRETKGPQSGNGKGRKR